ncbi:MAG: AzlD domain-containing protein [Trueperaceae bacterium]|nr:AzlD domain-containing protein [Trueperaceae bacterium]
MNTTWLWLVIVGMGVVTFALRVSVIAFQDRLTLPPALRRALRFVPAAVLAAIVAPAVVYGEGGLELSLANERLLAALVAALVAWWRKSLLLTLLAGMAAFWSLRALFG